MIQSQQLTIVTQLRLLICAECQSNKLPLHVRYSPSDVVSDRQNLVIYLQAHLSTAQNSHTIVID